MTRNTLTVTLLMLLTAPSLLLAERPTEQPASADQIVTGTVEAVYTHKAGRTTNYVVMLQVEEVVHGKDAQAGKPLYIHCFTNTPSNPPEPGARGHARIPKPGERITAFSKINRKGVHSGIYPDWYRAVKKK